MDSVGDIRDARGVLLDDHDRNGGLGAKLRQDGIDAVDYERRQARARVRRS